MGVVDKQSVLPYYYQLADSLREWIKNTPSNPQPIPLPSEYELSKANEISRATVRQALALLEREGLIFKARGKGSFIAKPRARYELTRLIPTTDEMLHRDWEPATQVISVEAVLPPSPVSEALRLKPNEKVFEVCRLRLGNGLPVCLQWSYLPVALCPDLPEHDLSESLTHLMEKCYAIRFISANVILRARLITPSEAKFLDVPSGSPVLYKEQVTCDVSGQPVEFLQSVWRSDRYEFTFTALNTQ